MKKVLVTGSRGLVGNAVCAFYRGLGYKIIGIDNGMRATFFGKEGLPPVDDSLYADIRDTVRIPEIVKETKPDLIVHAAAQPSHDWAAQMPITDFGVNALGTLNLLEAARQHAPEAPFVFLSTNKVYGDTPNNQDFEEDKTRYVAQRPIDELWPVDASMHSLFGCSKLAADIYTQEYGRYFGLPTCCLRCGCLTGPKHAGVEQHGFLSYLIKCAVYETPYTIYGYKGKQVRDNLHADDVAAFIREFEQNPRKAEVYNLGGGEANSISVIEALTSVEMMTDRKMAVSYSEEARKGDHICYISDLTKCQRDYPNWSVTKGLVPIFAEIAGAWTERRRSEQSR